MNAAAAEVLQPTNTAIVEFSATESALATMRAQLAEATIDCTTTAGDKEARESRRTLIRLRTALEDRRKELKAPLLSRGALIDAEAKRITSAIVELEQPIDAAIKAEEQRREALRAERERIERERVADIQSGIAALRGRALELVGASSSVIADAIAQAEADVPTAERFEEFEDEALAAHEAMLAKLRELLTAAEQNERLAAELRAQREEQERRRAEEEAQLAAEREELARLRAAEEARQAQALREREEAQRRAEAEQRAADEAAAAERRRLDEAAAVERERLAAEARAEQERIAAEQAAEQKRLDEEAAQQRQRAALAKARAEAKAIENATLKDAAQGALVLLRECGQAEHLATRKLAAAVERETA